MGHIHANSLILITYRGRKAKGEREKEIKGERNRRREK
jgi:hypothetical protein